MIYDFVGDIHGNFNKLEILFKQLGYVYNEKENYFIPPTNIKPVIVGDFINIGTQNIKVLDCLYKMYKKNLCYVISGNHEYFLCVNYKKYYKQQRFIDYLKLNYYTLFIEFNNIDKLKNYIEWLMELPLYYDFGKAKAVHAMWFNNSVQEYFKENNKVFKVIESVDNNSHLKEQVNLFLMGFYVVITEDDSEEKLYRLRWWELDKKNKASELFWRAYTYLPPHYDERIDIFTFKKYITNDIVFFGHYNLKDVPYLTSPTKCCLDFGAAKGGFLTCYRWHGESTLNSKNLIIV
ncbi:MAG: metallophosphoesterase [Bacteroidales bacterium]|nr:metallophosphoesterase [Bacteroidales bacterium]